MVQVGVMTFASRATRARHKKEPPPLDMSGGGSVVRGDKVLWSGSRLITLSPWPCCRGGVRACVVCAYLGIVTWTGWKVTITIRLLYPCSILCHPPILGL